MLLIPHRLTRDYLKSHPELTFVYGNNLYFPVYAGQSEVCEGLSNCYMVPTKFRNCKSDSTAYFSDYQLDLIVPAICAVIDLIPRDKPIILFPKIGMGCADLPSRAPKVFEFLMFKLNAIKAEYKIDWTML